MPDTRPFGELLRRYRKSAGLTQEALAERALLSVFTISALERGTSQLPRKETLTLLADALDLTTSERGAFDAAARAGGSGAGDPLPGATRPATPLVGREEELVLLRRHLAGDGPPVLLFAGEPGIGKSRLLVEAQVLAQEEGWTVLAGGCTRSGGQLPFAPLLQALESYLHRQSPAQLRSDLEGCAWLVRLLPELASGPIPPLPPWALTPDQERRLMFAAVRRFLHNVAGPRGTLLVLDDVQWAGTDALALLAALIQDVDEMSSVRVIGAYRDTEVESSPGLTTLLADLAQAGTVTHHHLGALAPAAAGLLLDNLLGGTDVISPQVRDQLLQRTGGQPFFLVSCAQGARTVGAPAVGATQIVVPWGVTQGVRQRVALLAENARDILGMAAVVGRVATRSVLVAMSDRPQADVLTGLETACRAQLLVEDGRDAYQFTHDLVREVVEGDLSAARRAVLHQRVAEVLESRPTESTVEILAYHYARSDAVDKAIVYLEQAGDRAAEHYANATAASYYQELVECLDSSGHQQMIAGACSKLAQVLQRMSHWDEALAMFQRACEVYQADGDLEAVGRLTAQMAPIYMDHGKLDKGYAILQAIIPHLEAPAPSMALTMVYTAAADLLCGQGQYHDALLMAERAADLARHQAHDSLLARAHVCRGRALRMLQQPKAANTAFDDAIRLAEVTGEQETLSQALSDRAISCLLQGKMENAFRDAARALDVGTHIGDVLQAAFAMHLRGWISIYSGEWASARRDFDEAARQSPPLERWGNHSCCLGLLAMVQGAWTEAEAWMEEGTRYAQERQNATTVIWAQRLLAELYLLQHRAPEALSLLQALLRQAEEHLGGHDVVFMLPLIAWAYQQMGDLEQAHVRVGPAIERARVECNNLVLPDALRVQALIGMAEQRWSEATSTIDEGLALCRQIGYPYAEGRLLHVYGELLVRHDEPALAREQMEGALAIFQRLGAQKDAEQVELELAALL